MKKEVAGVGRLQNLFGVLTGIAGITNATYQGGVIRFSVRPGAIQSEVLSRAFERPETAQLRKLYEKPIILSECESLENAQLCGQPSVPSQEMAHIDKKRKIK